MDKGNFTCPHVADPDVFQEALSYSEAYTGFTAHLIEKDYYCSLILNYIFNDETPLVFKGGTCLSKVYADFYRLSEDLDFVIPVPVVIPRNQRREVMNRIKEIYNKLSFLITIPKNISLHALRLLVIFSKSIEETAERAKEPFHWGVNNSISPSRPSFRAPTRNPSSHLSFRA